MRAYRKHVSGVITVHEAYSEPEHKLPPEARRERREDNKDAKRSRELHRRRKRHGRS